MILKETQVLDDERSSKRGGAELEAILEALIFASPDPAYVQGDLLAARHRVEGRHSRRVAGALKQVYERTRGLQLVEVAGCYQIVTRPDLNEWARRLFHERKKVKLAVQALQTLAVVVRTPSAGYRRRDRGGSERRNTRVLNTLLERHPPSRSSGQQVVGRPFMYATTKEFPFIRFGLNDLTELPKVEIWRERLASTRRS